MCFVGSISIPVLKLARDGHWNYLEGGCWGRCKGTSGASPPQYSTTCLTRISPSRFSGFQYPSLAGPSLEYWYEATSFACSYVNTSACMLFVGFKMRMAWWIAREPRTTGKAGQEHQGEVKGLGGFLRLLRSPRKPFPWLGNYFLFPPGGSKTERQFGDSKFQNFLEFDQFCMPSKMLYVLPHGLKSRLPQKISTQS